MINRRGYEMNVSLNPPSFLPVGLDMENLLDITGVTDLYRKYLDMESGQIHDGARYAEEAKTGLY